MPLRVSCDDHHFASSVEKTSFRCRPPDGKKIEEISMEVSDNAGKVIHKAEWNTGTIPATGKFPWDGEDNQSPAAHDSSGARNERSVGERIGHHQRRTRHRDVRRLGGNGP